jgi:hypothetical protein
MEECYWIIEGQPRHIWRQHFENCRCILLTCIDRKSTVTLRQSGYTLYVPFKLLATHCTYRSRCWLHTVRTVPTVGYTLYETFQLLATHCTYRSSWLHTVRTVPGCYTLYVPFELLDKHCTYSSHCWLRTICNVPAADYTLYVSFELLAKHYTYRSSCWLQTVCTVPASLKILNIKLICTQKTSTSFSYFSR